MIGGLYNETFSKYCFEIDPNLNMTAKESLKFPRSSICLATVIDKFILALGGCYDKKKASDQCEVYDSQANVWYTLNPMNKGRTATSALVLNHRYAYVFPGQNQTSWNTIEQLDLGVSIDVKTMVESKWNLLTVSCPEFTNTYSYGSA